MLRASISIFGVLAALISFTVGCSRPGEKSAPSENAQKQYPSPEKLNEITGLQVPDDLPDLVRSTNALSESILSKAKASASNPRLRASFEHAPFCDASSSAVDFRALGMVTPVKNQGTCGACWAFATNGVLESSYLALRQENIRASEQELVSCYGGSNGCQGGWWAFDFLKRPGIEGEAAYQYEAADSSCRTPLGVEFRVLLSEYVSQDPKTVRSAIPDPRELKQAMCKHGPLAVAFRATRSFIVFGNEHHSAADVFQEADPGPVNHGIVLVGWDEGKQAWIVKNSWGADWGENGFLRVKYGTNKIGLAAAWAEAWPKDYNPPPTVRRAIAKLPTTVK